MASGNKYQKYLNDKRTSKSSIEQLKGGIDTTVKILGAATIIGGGYSGLRYMQKTGILDDVAMGVKDLVGSSSVADGINKLRVSSDNLGATLKGVGSTIKSSGYKNTFFGRAHSELQANLKEEYLKVGVGANRRLSTAPTKFESYLLESTKVIRQNADIAIDNVRLDKIKENMTFGLRNYSGDKDKVDEITRNIVNQEFRKDKIQKGFKNDKDGHATIRGILDKYKANSKLDGRDYDKAEDLLVTSFAKYNKDGEFIKKYKGQIQTRYEAIDSQYKKAISTDLKKDSKISQAIQKTTGYRKVKIGEALDKGLLSSERPHEYRPIEYLDKRYKDAVSKSGKNLFINDTERMARRALKITPDLKDAYLDPMVFINDAGNVLDMRFTKKAVKGTMNTLGDTIQVPFINIKPFKMIGDSLGMRRGEMPSTNVFLRSTVMPSLENNKEGGLLRDYLFFNGSVVNDAGELVRENTRLTSARFGPWQRVANAVKGETKYDTLYDEAKTVGEFIKRDIFSFGYQEFESGLERKFSGISKFWNPQWEKNIWRNLTREGSTVSTEEPYVNMAFQKMYRTVGNSTTALDRDTIEILKPHLKGVLSDDTTEQLVNGTQASSVMSAIQELVNKEGASLAYDGQLNQLLKEYKEDPHSFDRAFRVFKNKAEYVLPENLEALGSNTSNVLTKMDEAEKILHSELLNQVELANVKQIGFMTDSFKEAGATSTQLKAIKKLNVHKELQGIAGEGYIPGQYNYISEDSLGKFSNFMERGPSDSGVWDDFKDIIYKANSNFGYGPGEKYHNALEGNEYLLMNRTKRPTAVFKDVMADINEATTLGEKASAATRRIWTDTGEQLGFGGKTRAGRNNMESMTTLSYASYFYGYRLNEGISGLGLGLSSKDMGSAQDIWKNLALKRALYPGIAVMSALYINDEIGNLTGEKPSQSVAKGYANVTIGSQTLKEVTGINAFGRHLKNIMPGVERIGESPVGRLLNTASFGLIGDTRTPGEMVKYYQSGSDPIRKGRFWSVGSSTPVYGDRIMNFRPNWYRRTMGDPMMTDSMYGSTGEYWANSWMPNPRNPLGFLKPGRRQHWVNKHYDDRPYPVTSSGLEEIPLVGPILDGTVGRILVPFRRRPGLQKAHRQYLEDINERITFETERSQGSGYSYITPGGRLTPSRIDPSMPIREEVNQYQAAGGYYGNSTGLPGVEGGQVVNEDGYVRMVDPTQGFAPVQSGSYINREDLTSINAAIVNKRAIKPLDNRSIQSLRDNAVVENMSEAVDPNSLAYRLGKTYYSATEIGGIYGFAATSIFGDYSPKHALQSTNRMLGMERKFWDEELGGLSGDLSEIGRRFLPHRDRTTNEYNPFKNKMPDWMPGTEYFTDFKHGDPYVKIQHGEMRLPGAGYEAMNKLHPDFYGEYGALDRMKILADVAPYSEQYKYYSSVVSRMHEAGLISDSDYEQVGEIKSQVSQVKQKYDFHSYKFKYADINKETVTVKRWIDANTFLTEEHPGAPIRLAGIKMPGQDDESSEAQHVRSILEKTIKPGSKIRIGLNADSLNKSNDDTMDTMDAVVYDALGESVNAKVARYKPMGGKNPVKVDWDDTSATSVNALYEPGSIKFGKSWEKFAHAANPFNTKFMQIRSPLEMYKRKELYGKSWQSWGSPIQDFIVPMFEGHFSRNPLSAAVRGAAFGWLAGAGGGINKIATTTIGAVISGVGASARTVGELAKRTVNEDATWIPKRRREQREIEEYFDMIKYVKYKGLYDKARKLAIKQEGIDPQAYVDSMDVESNSYMTNKLGSIKKWLKINKGHYLGDSEDIQSKLNEVNDFTNAIARSGTLAPAGPLAMQALKYRQEYQSTLYGADPHGDLGNIFRAMPKKDRPFFKEFMLAPPEEREEILRLVPENQKRFYQAKWGLKIDRKPTLMEYFSKHNLPGAGWDGWDPEHSMDEIKLKFLKKEGMEVGEFGYWKGDVDQVKDAPNLSGGMKDYSAIDIIALTKVLNGAGLTNADIQLDVEYLSEPPDSPINVGINLLFNRRKDVRNAINKNIASFI